jgi:hypothetical protein
LHQYYYGSFEKFEKAVAEEFRFSRIEGISDVVDRSIHAWFADKKNIRMINALKTELEFIGRTDIINEKENPFLDTTVVVTGTFESFSREGIVSLLTALGAKVEDHVTENTDYLIYGAVPGGKKISFAIKYGVNMLSEKGFDCLINYINETENEVETAVRICTERRPIGIMFLGYHIPFFRQRFQAIEVPCVLVTNCARTLEYSNLSSVSIDDTLAAKAAVERLLDLGHREIGILGGHIDTSDMSYSRYLGCKQAFESHSIPFDAQRQFIEAFFSSRVITLMPSPTQLSM